jgi:hypothetical protein
VGVLTLDGMWMANTTRRTPATRRTPPSPRIAAQLLVLMLASESERAEAMLIAALPMRARPASHVLSQARPSYLPAAPHERPDDAVAVSAEWTWQQLSKGAERAAAGYLACHAGHCRHYDVEAMRGAQQPVLQPERHVETRGRLRQTVRYDDGHDSAIQVWSVFEEGALSSKGDIGSLGPLGPLVGQDHHVETREADDLRQVKVTATKECVDCIVVSPGDCFFSGDRTIRGSAGREFQLWLTEQSGATDEALRIGLGLVYDQEGQLQHMTRIRQLALRDPEEITGGKMCSPRFAASQAVRSALSPELPCNFAILEQAVGQLAVFADNNINSPQGDQLLSGMPISQIIAASPWNKRRARVHSPGRAGDAAGAWEWEVLLGEEQGAESAGWLPPVSAVPADGASASGAARYMDVRFEDGVYARLPHSLASVGGFNGEVCFELGCLRSAALASGSFAGPLALGGGPFSGAPGAGAALQEGAGAAAGGLHRVLAIADAGQGTIHTLCYEVYTE